MIRQLWDLLPTRTHKLVVAFVISFLGASTAALWGGLVAWRITAVALPEKPKPSITFSSSGLPAGPSLWIAHDRPDELRVRPAQFARIRIEAGKGKVRLTISHNGEPEVWTMFR